MIKIYIISVRQTDGLSNYTSFLLKLTRQKEWGEAAIIVPRNEDVSCLLDVISYE